MNYYTYLAVCKVDYWDEVDQKERTEYSLVNGDFIESVEELKHYYGEHLNSIQVTLLEEGPVVITEELAKRFLSDAIVGL